MSPVLALIQNMMLLQSKTANIWTANEIDRRYGAQGLHATSVHPGIIGTNLCVLCVMCATVSQCFLLQSDMLCCFRARFVPIEALQSMMKPISGT